MKPTLGRVPVRFEYSGKFPEILNHLQSSLAITTYQAGKLAVVGVNGGQLDFSFHDFPLHFGGGHTSYEALAVGTPVVTLPGEFLRSRITLALYRKMNFTGLIVSTPQQYIKTAERRGTDRSERERVSPQILEVCPILFDDPHEVRCLETWLWSLT